MGIVRDAAEFEKALSFDEVGPVSRDNVVLGIGHGLWVSEKGGKAAIVKPGNELLHGLRGTHPVVAVGRTSVL